MLEDESIGLSRPKVSAAMLVTGIKSPFELRFTLTVIQTEPLRDTMPVCFSIYALEYNLFDSTFNRNITVIIVTCF